MAELELGFDYNASQLQWLLLAPGLINWVTQNTHLGLDRNYVEMDIDDTFTPRQRLERGRPRQRLLRRRLAAHGSGAT